MIKGKQKELININEEFILKHVSYYDIFRFYIPHLKLNQSFQSPFRKDSSPSACIKLSKKTGVPYYCDFGNDDTMNCWQYLMKLYNLNYNDTLRKVASDMGILNNPQNRNYKDIVFKYQQPKVDKSYLRFDIWVKKPKSLTNKELAYWEQYHITREELEKFHIYGVRKWAINGSFQPMIPNELVFAYHYPEVDSWKVYKPLNDKKTKWKTNTSITQLEGLETLKKDKICILTKAKKDRIVISKYIPECIACQSESEVAISPEDIEYIKSNCKKCYVWFDSDSKGVEASTYYNKYGFDYINFPKELEVKDPSDFSKKYGLEKFEEFLKNKKLI